MTTNRTANREQIRVSRQWLDLVKQLPQEHGRIIVIGGSDTGKTTLCRWLLTKLPQQARPALIDSDIGQSTVGPPSCIGWRFAGATDFEFSFTGDITPATNPTATLAGTVKAVAAAEAAGAAVVLLDTSGYLGGRGGFGLKSAKFELLSSGDAPLQAIFIGDSPDIRRLLAGWCRDPRLIVHRLPQSEVLVQKTRPQRTQWRQERFAEALAGADLRKLSMRNREFSGLPTAAELKAGGHSESDLQGLLLCFHDNQRRGICLGLLHKLDLPNQELLVRAPQAAEQAAGIMFGTLRLTAEGLEIGRL
ncbi:MAG: Clp1/GlmU family protein [Bacteroidota bacterium]